MDQWRTTYVHHFDHRVCDGIYSKPARKFLIPRFWDIFEEIFNYCSFMAYCGQCFIFSDRCVLYSLHQWPFMIQNILKDKPTKLFLGMTAFFCCNALIAESIGTKIFSVEKLFGLHPSNFTLFGQSGLSISLTCGVLLWPLEFVMTDIVNEFYGPKAVRRISFTAIILISYAFYIY